MSINYCPSNLYCLNCLNTMLFLLCLSAISIISLTLYLLLCIQLRSRSVPGNIQSRENEAQPVQFEAHLVHLPHASEDKCSNNEMVSSTEHQKCLGGSVKDDGLYIFDNPLMTPGSHLSLQIPHKKSDLLLTQSQIEKAGSVRVVGSNEMYVEFEMAYEWLKQIKEEKRKQTHKDHDHENKCQLPDNSLNVLTVQA